METALYHPEHGFYASGKTRTGQEGDFLTPVSPGPVLGQLLARQADELHEALGRPKPFNLIEQGADAGWLARDILAAARRDHPALKKTASLHLIEPRPRLRERQQATLRELAPDFPIQWHDSLESFQSGRVPCFFYSCELVDSFPVRIFTYRHGGWQEKFVDGEGSGFVWVEKQPEPPAREIIQRFSPPEVEGFTFEFRPESGPWMQRVGSRISQGLVLTLDYGFSFRELSSPAHAAGTLVALRHHQKSRDPLADPGEQDLTAHVNFTELEEIGIQAGLDNYGLTDFARGLTPLASPILTGTQNPTESWVRNFRHLTHPSFFGRTHKILVQGKSLPKSFTPSVVTSLHHFGRPTN